MAVRRLAEPHLQPKEFAFTAENLAWAKKQIAKYPEGRQAVGGDPAAVARAGAGRRLAAAEGDRACRRAARHGATSACSRSRPSTPCSIWRRSANSTCRSAAPRPACCAAPTRCIDICHRRIGEQYARHRGRQVLLGRGRVPRRLRERADGADQLRLLRGPHARELREDPRRAGRRPHAEAGPAGRPAAVRADRRRRPRSKRRRRTAMLARQGPHLPQSLRPATGASKARASAAPGTAPRASSRRAATGSSTR